MFESRFHLFRHPFVVVDLVEEIWNRCDRMCPLIQPERRRSQKYEKADVRHRVGYELGRWTTKNISHLNRTITIKVHSIIIIIIIFCPEVLHSPRDLEIAIVI